MAYRLVLSTLDQGVPLFASKDCQRLRDVRTETQKPYHLMRCTGACVT